MLHRFFLEWFSELWGFVRLASIQAIHSTAIVFRSLQITEASMRLFSYSLLFLFVAQSVWAEGIVHDPEFVRMEKEFGERFCRIHRNALVSLDKICGMKTENDSQQLIFRNIDDTLEVSRRHLPGIRKIIKNL